MAVATGRSTRTPQRRSRSPKLADMNNTTLESARMPSLRDKHLTAEGQVINLTESKALPATKGRQITKKDKEK